MGLLELGGDQVAEATVQPATASGNPALSTGLARGDTGQVTTTSRGGAVVGRERELAAVGRWLGDVPEHCAGLLFTGEPGIGKTTLWEAAIEGSHDLGATVLAVRAVESELPLGFAALGDLLGEVADDVLPELPAPLADALGAALLRTSPREGLNTLAVGRGLSEALRHLSLRGPLVLAIDDLQWLDAPSARALAFAVRRLGRGTGVVATLRAAVRDPVDLSLLLGDRLAEVEVAALSVDAVHDVLCHRGATLSHRESRQIHATSGGNPFYALELARSSAGPNLPQSLRRVVQDRLRSVSASALAAIETGAVQGPAPISVMLRFGCDAGAIDEAVASGVMVVENDSLRFVHPLLAAGALAAIPPMRRRELHRRAADLAHFVEDRARHLALATDGYDRTAASLLEQSAEAAQARGALESGINLIAHACRLTPPGDSEDLARREVIQADLLYLAGGDGQASALIEGVLCGDAAGVVRARALIHRVQHDSDPVVAVARLEEAVLVSAGDAVVQARALAALAWMRGVWGGDIEPASDEAEAAVALAMTTGDQRVQTTALTTAGTLQAFRGDPSAEVYLEQAVKSTDGIEGVAGDRSPFVAYAHQRWWRADWAGAEHLLNVERRHALRNGEESRLERLNVFQADLEIRRCHWSEATRLLDAALEWAGSDYWCTRALLWRALVLARRGDRAALADVAEARTSPAAERDPLLRATADYALGLVALAEERAQDAAQWMQPLPELLEAHGLLELSILLVAPDAVEASLDAGDASFAATLTAELERRAHSTRHPLGIPAAARCRGLVALAMGDTDGALDHLVRSISGFERAVTPYEAARTRLVTGNALRRAGRRSAAAEMLTVASDTFLALGAFRWKDRTDQELRRARPRPRADDVLTTAEGRVATLVVAGRTNREVAAQLYTSIATVEAHLTRIYRKVGVRSRTELTGAVADGRVRLH